MTRLKFPDVVIVVLATLGGMAILFLLGTRLALLALRRAIADTSGTGGTVFAISGGVTRAFFTVGLLVVLALLVAGAAALWRRSK